MRRGFIDIHAHGIYEPGCPCFKPGFPGTDGGQPFCLPDELIGWYDKLGIEKDIPEGLTRHRL